MANVNLNNTSNQTLRQLFANGMTYEVPRFQRDYAWDEEEWDDLWQDILGFLPKDGEPVHYMGYLVLQSEDQKEFTIIDGQQRLVTFSIIILAILKNLDDMVQENNEKEDNQKRLEQLRNTYLGYLDPVTLISKSKLRLNRNNNDFYQNYLVTLQSLPQRGLKMSEKLLKKGFECFYNRIKTHFKNNKSGAKLAQFVDMLADKMFFTVITVGDELNAFKVFETLNARGVRLSSTDLLKNYVFSVVSSEGTHESTEIENLDKRWQNIVGKLGAEKFPTFLRIFWNSYNSFVRKNELFKTIRSKIKSKQNVFDLIRKIDSHADIYMALKNPGDELWDKNEREYIQSLKMFGVTQPISMLLAAHQKFSKSDFVKLLNIVSVISFRYNVIGGLNPNEQEKIYNKVGLKISTSENVNLQTVKKLLMQIYVNDESFKSSFSQKSLKINGRNKKLIKYVLFSIEKHLTNVAYDPENDKYSIEHILPENPDENWDCFDDDQFIERIGNYVMLEASKNRDIGNKDFNAKRIIYRSSLFALTKKVADEYIQWNESNLQKHQDWMAKQAITVWKLNI